MCCYSGKSKTKGREDVIKLYNTCLKILTRHPPQESFEPLEQCISLYSYLGVSGKNLHRHRKSVQTELQVKEPLRFRLPH